MSGSFPVDWLGPRCYGLAQHEHLVLSTPVQKVKDSELQVAWAPFLTEWLRGMDAK